MITREFGIPVTSPGAILRRERDLGTPLGLATAEITQRGGLVSDEIIVKLIEVETQRRVERGNTSADPMDYVMRGDAALRRPVTKESYREAQEMFERALQLDAQEPELVGG